MNETISSLKSSISNFKSSLNSLPDLLYQIFGYSHSSGLIERIQIEEGNSKEIFSKISRRVSTFIKREERPFEVVIDLLLRMFDMVNDKAFRTEFRISVEDLPFHTSRLWAFKGKRDPIVSKYFSLLDYTPLRENEKSLSVSTGELFFISFLQSLKKSGVHSNYAGVSNQKGESVYEETEKNLQVNIYLVLLRKFLEKGNEGNRGEFEKLMFFVEDFLLNEIVYGPKMMFNSPKSHNDYLLPKPQVLDGIMIFLHFHQKFHGPFGITSFQEISRFDSRQAEVTQKTVTETFFSFFKEFLLIWNTDFSNSSPFLAEVSKIWLKFLDPASILDPNNLFEKIGNNDDGFFSLKRRMDVLNKSRHEISSTMNEFLQGNLDFYKDLFLEFLSCFSNLTTFSIKDILMLKEIISSFFIYQDFYHNESDSGILQLYLPSSFFHSVPREFDNNRLSNSNSSVPLPNP